MTLKDEKEQVLEELRTEYHNFLVYDKASGSRFLDEKYLEEKISAALDQIEARTLQEVREKIDKGMWHEVNCPSHSMKMGSEKDCDCSRSFVLDLFPNEPHQGT